MIIQVTEDDIQNGKSRDAGACPIALALQRAFPKERIAVITMLLTAGAREYWFNHLEIGDKVYRANDYITDFIRDFDNELPVEPFAINLDELILLQG